MRQILPVAAFGRSLFLTMLLVCFAAGLSAQAFTAATAAGDPVGIPDNAFDSDAPDLATMASKSVTVTGIDAGNTVTDLEISMKLNHTWVGDLTIFVEAPNGNIITLMNLPGNDGSGCCGDSSDLDEDSPISFSDAAGTSAEAMGATIFGTDVVCEDDGICSFSPNAGVIAAAPAGATGALVATLEELGLAGDALNGEWTLWVGDEAGGDVGSISGLIESFVVSGVGVFVEPPCDLETNLACIGNVNLTLNDECRALLIPEMVVSGDYGCITPADLVITVMDSDPSNGPIIDGCGTFNYTVELEGEDVAQPTIGFTGDFAPGNWDTDNDAFSTTTGDDVNTTEFTASSMTLTTFAGNNDGGAFVAQANYTFAIDGTIAFDYDYNGVDPGFDAGVVFTNFEGDFNNQEINVLELGGPASGTVTADVSPGDVVYFRVFDDGFQPFAPNTDEPTIMVIDNFRFDPEVSDVDLSEFAFENCWGTVTAEDKTAPIVVNQVAPIDLLCVDVDENRVELLDNSISRCYNVFGSTGATVPGSMEFSLNVALRAGTNAPVVPTFTDGCAEQLEVCVTESFATDANDPMCEDMVLTRTFTATEVSSCVSAAGEGNAPAVASYVITFTRPGLDDLNGDNIPATANFESCGDASLGNPAPRPDDYPFLAIGGRTFNLSIDQTVCNIGVTYADGPSTSTCPNTYKFVRTYTVIDWCNPSEVATFSQIVKVGDTTAPDFEGPTQDRNLDGFADGDLIYTTNAGSICAAYLVLDAPGVSVTDACTADEDITLTATIYPGGDLNANPIGAFEVDLFNGTPEVTTPIPVGMHLLVYTYSDDCGNEGSESFPFTVVDRTAPVAVCEDGLNISISSGGTNGGASTGVAVLTPDMIDAGSSDDCSDVTLSIARVNGSNINTEPYDDQLILTCADLGTVRVGLRVEDANGNVNFCWLDVLVEDKNIPTCIPPGPMNITCVEYNDNFPADITEVSEEELAAIFGSAVGIDNCAVTVTSSVTGTLNNCGIGSIVRSFVATDEVGFTNNGACTQVITIRGVHDYRITFPTDDAGECADIPAFDGLATDEYACDLITTNVTVDTIEAVNAPDVCFTLRVNYDVINFCEYNQLGECYRIPRDGDGIRDPETQLLYLNVIPENDANTGDDIAFLSRFTDRNFNPGAPQFDQLIDDGDDTDGSDDDNDNDNIDNDAYAQDNSRGFFCYVQFIDVYDSDAPSIEVDAPEECFAGTSATCTAEVVLTFTAEDDCIAPVVSLELDANYNPGDLDFTGFVPDNAAALGISIDLSNDGANYTITATNVPVGNHAIRVRANDGCGNTDLDIIEFCVEGDKAPTPICIQTLTVTLMPDGAGDGMAAIWASDFIASDVEDCFGNVIENYSIYREAGFDESQIAVGDLGIDFTCADFGESVPVRVYAIADNGTSDYCSVIVEVQAFQDGLCDGDGGNLAGTIATQNEEVVAGVEVTLTGANDMDQVATTDANGFFGFTNVPMGADYTIQPANPVAVDLATVTVTDVVMIGNVILGSESFASNYDYLAADVDQDQYLSVGDMVAIQRVILGLDNNFASGASWGFVPADVDVSNPFAETFPGVYNVNNMSVNVFDADFVGFAYGDVNSVGRSSASLEVEDARLEAGQTHSIAFSGAELAGFQGTLELAAGLELVDVAFEGEGGLNLNGAAEGVIAMMFRSAATVTVEVRATEAGLLSDMVSLTSNVTLAEGVNANGTSGALNLNFAGVATGELVNALEQNMPNPVADVTTIAFTLAQAGDVKLTIQDIAGRTVSVRDLAGVAGRNLVEVNVSELGGATGVLSYTLVAGDFSATKKMVVVR